MASEAAKADLGNSNTAPKYSDQEAVQWELKRVFPNHKARELLASLALWRAASYLSITTENHALVEHKCPVAAAALRGAGYDLLAVRYE